jgi:hypothetical protein
MSQLDEELEALAAFSDAPAPAVTRVLFFRNRICTRVRG